MARAGRLLRAQQAHDRGHAAAVECWRRREDRAALLGGRMPVTLTDAQRCALAYALGAARHEVHTGESRGEWTFHRELPADLRDAFDGALLAIQWPSVYLAGTVERRFVEFVRDLAEAGRGAK